MYIHKPKMNVGWLGPSPKLKLNEKVWTKAEH